MELSGKIALVTGGGRGLGRATALALAEQGARVVAVARSLHEVEETARRVREQFGVGQALAIRADVAREADVVAAFDQVRKRWGGVDILINNAGDAGATKPIMQLTLAEWQQAIDVNVTGAFLCAREAMRDMSRKRWGRIVNVSSGSAIATVPSMAAFSVSKAAVEHFTRILAAEGAALGIVAVALRPGLIDTRMQEDLRSRTSETMPPELRAMFSAYRTRGMLVPPERPARLIAYLCGNNAADFSGRILEPDDILVEARD